MDILIKTGHRQFACSPLFSNGKVNGNARCTWKVSHEVTWRVFEAAVDPGSKSSSTGVRCHAAVLQGASPDLFRVPLVAIIVPGQDSSLGSTNGDHITTSVSSSEVQHQQKQQANSYVKLRRPQDTASSISSKPNPVTALRQSVSPSKAKPKTLSKSKPSFHAWTHTQSAPPPPPEASQNPLRPVATPAAPPQVQPTPQQATARPTPPAAAPPPSLTSAAPTGRASLLQTPPPRPIINLQGPLRPPPPLPPTSSATDSQTQRTQPSKTTSSTTQITSTPPGNSASSSLTGPSSVQHVVSANSSLKAAFERDRRSLFDTARKQEFYPASHIGFTTPHELPPCKEWDARERRSAEQRAQQQRQHQQWQLRQPQPTPSQNSAHSGPHSSSRPPHDQQSPPSTTGHSLPTYAAGLPTPSTVTPVSTVTHPSADTSHPPSHGPSLQASSVHPSTSNGHSVAGGMVRHMQQTRRPWSSPLSHPREQEEVPVRRRILRSTSSMDDDDVSGGSSSSGSGTAASTALPAATVPAGKASSGKAGAGRGAVVQTAGDGSSSSSSGGAVTRSGSSMDEPSSGLGQNSPATVTLKSSRSRKKAAAAALEAEQTGSSSPEAAAAATVPHASSSVAASSSNDASTSHAGSLISSSSSIDGSNGPDPGDTSSSGSSSSSKVAVPAPPPVVHRTRIHQPAEWNHSQPRPPPPSEEEWRRVLVGEHQSKLTDHYGEDAGFVRKVGVMRGNCFCVICDA